MPKLDNLPTIAQRTEIAQRSAMLSALGVSFIKQYPILKDEFKCDIPRKVLEECRKSDVYFQVYKEYTESVVKSAIIELKKRTSALVPKIILALEKALDDGNIQAIPHALKILGVEGLEPVQQAQNIQVILPGAKQEKAVNDG